MVRGTCAVLSLAASLSVYLDGGDGVRDVRFGHRPPQSTLATAERSTAEAKIAVREPHQIARGDPARALDVEDERSERVVRRWLGYVVVLAAIWTVLLWGGYVLAQRLSR